MENTAALRTNLQARYDSIAERLGRIDADLQHKNQPLNADWEEQAVELENEDVLQALSASIRIEMEQLRHSLERLDAGTYGICVMCGQPIPAQRMAALPYATQCVHCAGLQ